MCRKGGGVGGEGGIHEEEEGGRGKGASGPENAGPDDLAGGAAGAAGSAGAAGAADAASAGERGSAPDTVTDPFTDPDPVREVEFALVELAAQMDAAMLRFLEGLRRFDALRGYLLGGFPSTAHWLVARCGVTLATARERVRVARTLEGMPLTAAALGEGRISYSVARALTRTRAREINKVLAGGPGATLPPMDPEEEAVLLEAAESRTAGAVEAMVRAWALKTPADERERELERMASRTLSLRPREDGMWEIRGLLTPEIGAAVLAAVESAADQIFREGRPGSAYAAKDPRDNPYLRVNGVPLAAWEAQREAEGGKLPDILAEALGDRDTAAAARRRRADALGLVCQMALAGTTVEGDGGARAVQAPREGNRDNTAAGSSRGEAPSAGHATSGLRQSTSGLRAATTQVVLHVDLEVLRRNGQGADSVEGTGASRGVASPATMGTSHLAGSVRVSAETSRRLSCDASVVPLVVRKGLGERKMAALAETTSPATPATLEAPATLGAAAEIVGLGAATRTVSPPLRRALDARDGGCRFPGCEARHTEAHHVKHWADGGKTALSNLILLCHHHHTLLHEGGWRMAWPAGPAGVGAPTFFDPLGGVHHEKMLGRRALRQQMRGTRPGSGLASGPGADPRPHPHPREQPASEDLVARMIRDNEARRTRPDP